MSNVMLNNVNNVKVMLKILNMYECIGGTADTVKLMGFRLPYFQ